MKFAQRIKMPSRSGGNPCPAPVFRHPGGGGTVVKLAEVSGRITA
ncbi:hypothetical protein ACKVM7_001282 [Arthrobacter russicus]|uniref:Uncharacterized protein n=1 Tax=Arthrobacter russicus TaxID=172040 RepID=A0ABU1JH50_9MICC|nr:hypothetical protein [Arthrobacter russicus]